MKHQWNGEIPSPGGKVARRKPGRMRNGDAVGQEMHPNKTDKGFGFNHFYGVHRNILLFAVPHQSPKSVPKCRFGRQLYELRCDCHWQSIDFDSLRGAPPPGEAMGAAAPIRYTTVNVLTKADNLNINLLLWCVKPRCIKLLAKTKPPRRDGGTKEITLDSSALTSMIKGYSSCVVGSICG